MFNIVDDEGLNSSVSNSRCFLTPALQPLRAGLVLGIPYSVKERHKLVLEICQI